MNEDISDIASRLLREVAFLLSDSGVSKRSAMEMLEQGFERLTETHDRDSEPLTARATYHLSRMLYVWRTRDQYVDSIGEPLALPVHGAGGSIESVFNEARAGGHESELSLDEAIAILKTHKTIVATKIDRYKMTAVEFDIGASGQAALVFVGHLADMATTLRRNVLKTDTDDRRMALFSEVNAIQEDKIAEVNNEIRKSTVDWLLSIDDYLEHLQSRSEDGSKAARVKVGVYLYSDKDE